MPVKVILVEHTVVVMAFNFFRLLQIRIIILNYNVILSTMSFEFCANMSLITVTCDLWPPKSDQFILEFKWTFVPEVCPLEARMGQMWGHSNLDLWPQKSNQFFFQPKWMSVDNLKRFPPGVLDISRSWEWHQFNNLYTLLKKIKGTLWKHIRSQCEKILCWISILIWTV